MYLAACRKRTGKIPRDLGRELTARLPVRPRPLVGGPEQGSISLAKLYALSEQEHWRERYDKEI